MSILKLNFKYCCSRTITIGKTNNFCLSQILNNFSLRVEDNRNTKWQPKLKVYPYFMGIP